MKDKRAASYGMAIEAALSDGKGAGIFTKTNGLFLQSLIIKDMLWEDTHAPRPEGRRIEPFINHANRQGVNELHTFDRFIIRSTGREVFWVHDGFIGKLHIIGIKYMAVMESHVGP